ncbi:uncharacterized protein LOC120430689 [Culex pipiens pallens]|uniref:uncharacterized protein LOC120430352 n=1 Tax=Culex pipiens pallens TaxID=42434 RepID=UPI001952E032|nr:uncharacterized protein LOC120430352 [Culex pipiens pallens]XP_052562109.1 uncharacterized protein LOC120430689 [Culex pipiens pallens]
MGTYWTNCGRKINARIVQKSPNVLNLSIENTELVQERLLRLKLAAALLFLYAFLILVPTGWNQLWIHGIFVVLLGGVAYSYTKIVKNENLVLVKDFALQYSTHFIGGGAKNVLIPIKHIHDVVINEVFHNLKVVFSLSVLTKGNLFKNQPIVTLLKHLNPRVDCLEMIYNELHNILSLEND